MESTLKFWNEMQENLYDIYISNLVVAEIDECSEPKKAIMYKYLDLIHYQKIILNNEIISLANNYLESGVVPVKCRDDAVHLAAASVYKCNVLASWNFKHMVKLKTILGVNAINKKYKYNEITILSPDSIISEED